MNKRRARDFFGYDLEVGQTVVFSPSEYTHFVRAKILKVTDKMVILEYVDDWHYAKPTKKKTRQYHKQVIVCD